MNMRNVKLILLRHGKSQWNQENRFTGWTDVPLNEEGITEAHTAGRCLSATWDSCRCCLHIRIETGHQHALDRTRRTGFNVDSG